jgi:hypothetical protein
MVVMAAIIMMVDDGFRLRLASKDFFESICSCSSSVFVAEIIPRYSSRGFQISAIQESLLER